ncbi:hypothetical protein Y032_0106g3734 [Ancylostoma ceylanicum]|nr:hypothetical protein Y032_0106g3734 [Ancylostoma ceylanicum]
MLSPAFVLVLLNILSVTAWKCDVTSSSYGDPTMVLEPLEKEISKKLSDKQAEANTGIPNYFQSYDCDLEVGALNLILLDDAEMDYKEKLVFKTTIEGHYPVEQARTYVTDAVGEWLNKLEEMQGPVQFGCNVELDQDQNLGKQTSTFTIACLFK